jgi:hypothetical protein
MKQIFILPLKGACACARNIANGQPARHQLSRCPKENEYEIAGIRFSVV